MIITNAKYDNVKQSVISAVFDGKLWSISAVVGNRHYDAIIAQNISIAAFTPPQPPNLGARKSAVSKRFKDDEALAALLEVIDDRASNPPGRTLADILLKVT